MITKELSSVSGLTKEDILRDYRLACESRQASLLGRKEVFAGKAKFGIFGDGKEIAQLTMARAFQKGDWRSGYYRDQTFMIAIGELTWHEYFAQLYAHTDIEAEPSSAGRMMNGHFATRSLHADGSWKNLLEIRNSSSDISPTGAQMPRLLGLAYASKLYRQNPDLQHLTNFSIQGNEVAFGTIGNGATAEGVFWETMNAAGVLQVPMLVSVWDDGYGISVPNSYQITKEEISKLMSGFQRTETEPGLEIIRVNGWDYPALLDAYLSAAELSRKEHVPVLLHVAEMTQPQGHSTSGSHERYKTKERLAWEIEYDCIRKMREWIVSNDIASEYELQEIENQAKEYLKQVRSETWEAFVASMKPDYEEALGLLEKAAHESRRAAEILALRESLAKTLNPIRSDATATIKKALRLLKDDFIPSRTQLIAWLQRTEQENAERYNSHLYSHSDEAAIKIAEVKPIYTETSPLMDGWQIIRACFDAILTRDVRVFAIGEDVGMIGDVNQGFSGLQKKHGELRVTDTGIRETTIIGQGIGAALRGLRPITEIQYVDYIPFAIQTLSDDLASLHYRTKGGQKAPVIIRTRGHRLEGVFHSGSPMSLILSSLRGLNVIVPRNFTQASGFYNTILKSDEPALVVEPLNAYRLKERMPENIDEICVPVGVPEILRKGSDITIVTYGAMCRIVLEAARQLFDTVGIDVEVIDVQTLLPFDIHKIILQSVQKTNRVIFADEDVPGGASAFMMDQVLVGQNAYRWLDSAPKTIAAQPHRPAYTTDGDYFSKPNIEMVFDMAYEIMHDVDPNRFPALYQ
ncbi:thiamine pyrophosphate-dependent enzyme [Cytophagaceae bacterium YF14B1]|uniref:3-methyl-2-oxobutanoate dehydrogenase (2-methylpropanoyl-transferring) n=1 Tax=Xanthocytophaga flava TaxID=3048013 RepID=A0AAE3U710_9BACT|nr:thiamine pyrophosphate-dependent enzyme [Xanthocytophaga flavus]MDJ1479658.1 thiamine pyrophosphate-dependent enzyme [Xanthocytophaga flavus]